MNEISDAGIGRIKKPIISNAPPSDLTDDDLLDEFERIVEEIRDITDQLAEDQAAGFIKDEGWRNRASFAKRKKFYRSNLLAKECITRSILEMADQKLVEVWNLVSEQARQAAAYSAGVARNEAARIERERLALEAAKLADMGKTERVRLITEAALERERARAARLHEHDDRQKDQNEMFVEASRRVLSKDEFIRIWEVAREMFPGSTAWNEPKTKA